MSDPRRILLIRPSALGDVVRSVPLVASLRQQFPGATIEWLVNAPFAEAVRHHPGLSGLVPFDRQHLGATAKAGRLGPSLEFLAALRRADYDLVIDAQGLARSGLFAWATRAPRRVGFADAREMGWIGLNERHAIGRDLHSVDRMLALLKAAGVEPLPDMTLTPPPREIDRLDRDSRFAHRRVVVLAPGSKWPGKRWPADRFASVARALLERGIETIALVGSASERASCAPLLEINDPRVVDLMGQTSVGGLMAVIARASLVVANDSAPVHMAVGLDRPMVALYGPTDIDRVGPYRRAGDVIQHRVAGEVLDHKNAALGAAMMGRIAVDEVLAACDARLSR